MNDSVDLNPEENSSLQSFLTFKLDNEVFAVEVMKVIEILEVANITKVPRAPKHMAGVLNLRGKVLPLIDSKIKFGLDPIVTTVETCIVVIEIPLEGENLLVGTLVDSVLEVVDVLDSSIQNSPSIEAKFDLEFVSGVFKKDDIFIKLMNLDKVFSLEDNPFLKESMITGN